MNTLLRKPNGIFASLIVVMIMLILPQASLAKVFISDGTNPGSPGGGEGDPLDSNDYSGGGGDGEVHQRRIIPRDFGLIIFDLMASQRTVMLRVDYIGSVPVFSVHVVNVLEFQAEADHVR